MSDVRRLLGSCNVCRRAYDFSALNIRDDALEVADEFVREYPFEKYRFRSANSARFGGNGVMRSRVVGARFAAVWLSKADAVAAAAAGRRGP